jgi:glycosyltransferase involved in cell wall biosynthesis
VRLAWIIDGDIGQPTGGYIYDRLVVEGLRAHGDEVTVLGIDAAHLVSPSDGERLGTRTIDTRPDAVVGDALCIAQLGPAFEWLAGKVPRVLLVHHFMSWEVDRRGRDALRVQERRAVMASDGLVVTSGATAARLGAEYPRRAIDIAPPGADRLPRYSPTRNADGGVELLFVGSLIARKGLPMLFDALERVADPRLSLHLVGDPGREPRHARGLAARVAMSPVLRTSVTAFGVVDDDVLARHMARAQALVLPSSLEGYGMVLAEALWAGLAVIAARQPARSAGLEGHGAALVFDDQRGLVDALARLAGDAPLRQAMQQAAGAAVLPRWHDGVQAFRAAVRRLTTSKAARGPDRACGP